MPWPRFSAVMADVFRGEGYAVDVREQGPASLVLERTGYTTLVSCRRWKVKETGIAPLRELAEAATASGARDCIYVTVGTFTDSARAFARENRVRMLSGPELAQLAAPVVARNARKPTPQASAKV